MWLHFGMAGWDTRPRFFHTEYPKIQVGICTRTPQLGLYKLHYLSRGSTGIHWHLSHSAHLGWVRMRKSCRDYLHRKTEPMVTPWVHLKERDCRATAISLLMMPLRRSPGFVESFQDSAILVLSLFSFWNYGFSKGYWAEIMFKRTIHLVLFFLFLWTHVFPSLAFHPNQTYSLEIKYIFL